MPSKTRSKRRSRQQSPGGVDQIQQDQCAVVGNHSQRDQSAVGLNVDQSETQQNHESNSSVDNNNTSDLNPGEVQVHVNVTGENSEQSNGGDLGHKMSELEGQIAQVSSSLQLILDKISNLENKNSEPETDLRDPDDRVLNPRVNDLAQTFVADQGYSRDLNLVTPVDHGDTQSRPYETKPGFTKPDTYDGTTSWTDYMTHFEMASRLNKWGEDVKAMKLAVSLKGTARSVLSDLNTEQLRNYEALLEALGSRFEPKTQCEMFRAQMNARTRKNNESLPQLAQDIKRIVRMAYPTAPSEVKESLAYKCFRDALNDRDMEWAVCQGSAENIDEALNLALKYEAFRVGRDRRTSQKHSVRAMEETDPESKPEIRNDRADAILNRIAQLEEQVHINPSMNNYRSSRSCYYCNKPGHIKRDCRKLKADQSRANTVNPNQTDQTVVGQQHLNQ